MTEPLLGAPAAPPGPAHAAGRGGSRGSGRRWLAALVLGLVAAGAVAVVLLRSDDGAAGDVVLQPAGAAGPDDFAGDLDLVPAAERGAVPADPRSVEGVGQLDAPVPLAGRRVGGGEPSLYAAAREQSPCDVAELAALLTGDGNAARAGAWFAALGDVEERQRDDYLGDLTPVRLRLDTRVTNHRYVDGRAVPYPAVLQAGTAVLVDARGTPRVRCLGANPLGEPEQAASGLTADAALDVDALARNPRDAWEGFDPATVVVVEGRQAVEGFDVLDLAGGDVFTRPVGSDGFQDRGVFGPEDRTEPGACEQDCHELQIAVETVAGTPASVTWEGPGRPTSQTETALTWGPGQAGPGTYRYDVHHAWEVYRVLEPGEQPDLTFYDDPAHDNETLQQDYATPDPSGALTMLECLPGEVTITVTVDGAVAQSTTENVPCTSSELSYVLE